MRDRETQGIRQIIFCVAEIGMDHQLNHSFELMFFGATVTGYGTFYFQSGILKYLTGTSDQTEQNDSTNLTQQQSRTHITSIENLFDCCSVRFVMIADVRDFFKKSF